MPAYIKAHRSGYNRSGLPAASAYLKGADGTPEQFVDVDTARAEADRLNKQAGIFSAVSYTVTETPPF
jgi:hypothetical protein